MIKKFLNALIIIMVIGGILNFFGCGEQKKSVSEKSVSKKRIETKKPTQTASKKQIDRELVVELKKKDCVEYIECLSAKVIAKEYGKTESWAVRNYTVNLWEKTSINGKGKKVGEMRVGSRALIIDIDGNDYKVISPLDKTIGWINKVQIAKTLYQNPNTFEKCEG